MARPRKKAKIDGSSASFNPPKKQQPQPKPTDPVPRYELRQRKTRYGDIKESHASSDDEQLEPKDAALKHRRGQPICAYNRIQQFNPPSGEGEGNASVIQPEIANRKGKDEAPKRKRGPPKPQISHVKYPHTPSYEQNAPRNGPNPKVKGLGLNGKQAQPRKPNDHIEKPRNPSDTENANVVHRTKPDPRLKGVGRKRKHDQHKKPHVHVENRSISPGKENPTTQDQPEPKIKVFAWKGKQMQPNRAKSKFNKAKKSNRKVADPKQVDAQIDILRPKNFNPTLGLSEFLKDNIISKEYSVVSSESDGDDDSRWEESFDIKDNREVFGMPTPDDVKRWKEGAYFIKSNSGLEDSRWIGKRPLGQGSFGISGLWQQCNTDGRVKKQMVIKQIGEARHMWEPEKPEEVRIMEKMKMTKIRGVVGLINYKRYHRKRVHRIYMEFCPYGDLSRLIERYKRFGRHFPEPFLWQTFFYLAEAASAMRFGPSERNDEWDYDKEIVHRDIKPPNIFLGRENKRTGLPFYPTAKMGDFGLAIETQRSDPHNPHDYAGCGTANYMAPEQQPLHERDRRAEREGKRPTRHILSPTNVFAIGATMFELITLERADHWFDETRGLGALGSQVARMANNSVYSHQLIELIVDCMNAEPTDRVDVKQLHSQIKRHRDLIAKDYGSREPKNNDRLYYRGNEINEMSPGKSIPLAEKIERRDILEPLDFMDPSLSPVRFPDLGPAAYENEEDGPEQVLRKGDEANEPFEIYDEGEEEGRPSHIRTSEAEFAKWLGRSRTKSKEISQVEKGALKRPAKPLPLGQHASKAGRKPPTIDLADSGRQGDIEHAENGVDTGTPGDGRARGVLEGEDAGEDADNAESLLGWAGAAMRRLFDNQNARNGTGQGDQQKGNAQEHQQSKQKGDQHDSRIRPTPSYSPITSRGLPSSEISHTGNYRLKRSRAAPQNLSLETSPSLDIQPSQLSGTEMEEALHDENYRRKRTRIGGNQKVVPETPAPSKTLSIEAHSQGGSGTGVQNRAPRVNRPRKRWGPRSEW